MVECKSQASFTARRLVGQIRTIDRRVGLARKTANGPTGRQKRQLRWTTTATSALATGGQHSPPNRGRQFSYNFVINQEQQPINNRRQNVNNDDDYEADNADCEDDTNSMGEYR